MQNSQPAAGVDLGFSDERPPPGCHLCYIYSDDDERLDILAKFLRAGLTSDERLLTVSDKLSPAELRQRMAELGVDLADERQAMVESAEAAYAPGGRFSTRAMLEEVADFYASAREMGFAGARTVGEMNWAARDIRCAETAMEYEAKVNQLLEEYPCTSMCQYDARLFSGELLMDVLQIHPYMVVRGQLVLNPYYRNPEDFLEEYHSRHGAHEHCRE